MRPNACEGCDVGWNGLKYPLAEAVALGYDVTDLEGNLATKADLERIIATKHPLFFHGFGHGNTNVYTGQNKEIVLEVGLNENILSGMIVYLLSCLTAVELGPAIIAAGGLAYIGYNVEWAWMDENGYGDPYTDYYAEGYYRASNAIPSAFFRGFSAEEAYYAGINTYNEWIDRWATSNSPDAPEVIHWLVHDRDGETLIGDGKARIPVVGHTLIIDSEPQGAQITVDGSTIVTPWSKEIVEREYVITASLRIYTPTAIYAFDHWEDGNTNAKRTISLTQDITIKAYYVEIPSCILTVNSEPSGVSLLLNNTPIKTPYSQALESGIYTLTTDARVIISGAIVCDFNHWEDGSKGLTRTINLTADIVVTAYYTEVPTHLLYVKTEPYVSAAFRVDGSRYFTNVIVKLLEGMYTVTMPSQIASGGVICNFKSWENGSTDPIRVIELTKDTVVTAYYSGYTLTLNSSPVSGVTVEIDGVAVGKTPLSVPILEGSHLMSVPEEVET